MSTENPQPAPTTPKITVVIEFRETGGGGIWPVSGRSGTVWGYASQCPKRGTFCLRMPLEEFQKCRDDIFNARHKFYYPIPDVEVEGENAETLKTETLKALEETLATATARIAELEASLKAREAGNPPVVEVPTNPPDADTPEEISNEEAAALEGAKDPTDLPPAAPAMTPSEAGAILGNGIPEPEDTEAAKVLAAQSKSKIENDNVEHSMEVAAEAEKSAKQPEAQAQAKPASAPAKAEPAKKAATAKGKTAAKGKAASKGGAK